MTGGDRFTQIPRRFHDALRRGDVNARQYLLGCYLASEIDFRTGEVALTLDAIIGGGIWEWSPQTLRDDLKALRPAWIDYTTKQGQRSPYVFRLTGLAVSDEATLNADFTGEPPSRREVTSRERKSEQLENPQPECDPVSSPLQADEGPKKRRDETRQETFSEEEGDHLLGGVTKVELEPDPLGATERMLEVVREIDSEKPGVADKIKEARAAADRRNGNRIPVPGEDDFLTHLRGAYRAGHVTRSEWFDRIALNGWIVGAAPPLGEAATLAEFQRVFAIDEALDEMGLLQ